VAANLKVDIFRPLALTQAVLGGFIFAAIKIAK
jgi:hypothetical protein